MMLDLPPPLIPAKAGAQVFSVRPGADRKNAWVPAFAGMSGFGGLS